MTVRALDRGARLFCWTVGGLPFRVRYSYLILRYEFPLSTTDYQLVSLHFTLDFTRASRTIRRCLSMDKRFRRNRWTISLAPKSAR
jgi:hypothetical protein